ncbi:MAG: hypothetical protein J6B98_02715 [Bacilli bacterium]|nr:hypothetical protein [Bacilli bacterium]
MKLGYKISLLVVGILLAISTTIGSSYAVWTITETQETSNEVTSGCFSLSYTDVFDEKSTHINLPNAYPITDEKGLSLSPYTVVLKNTCNIAAKYDLTITTDSNNTLSEEYLKTNLVNITTNTAFDTKKLNKLTKVNLDENLIETLTTKNGITINNTYLLANGVLNPDEEVKYELRIWLDKDAPNETMNSKFTAAVSNVAYATESK